MLVYKGINALSDFRQKTLLDKIRQVEPSIENITAEYMHFVDTNVLSKSEDVRIKNLLNYESPYLGKRSGTLILITPRPGTISSWSSKATDIIHNAGIKKVNRVERGTAYYIESSAQVNFKLITSLMHDRMTDAVFFDEAEAEILFITEEPNTFKSIDIKTKGKKALEAANSSLGLALTADEITYLHDSYKNLGRNPTDVELMMFAQINSEHCRHKVFNAEWEVDGVKQSKSLFKKIKNTYELGGEHVLSAYSDNAAVLSGSLAKRFFPDPVNNKYGYIEEPVHIVTKVETHNHPTAIAPSPGAATGSGGEIRDEGATGRGAKPKMGLTGFTVSNLCINALPQPWERQPHTPDRISSPLEIMIDAPLGGAAYNNEFGRPNLAGYFRTFEQNQDEEVWGYHKPIMIAGGVGNIKAEHVDKKQLKDGTKIIVLGGPAMLIGLGGGAASSMQTGQSDSDLDFASVQRANAEMERRVQEVINTCWAYGDKSPIVTIHDVGAGGLSNALPELVHDSGLGAVYELRKIPSAEPGLSPLEIWCNESQERYVLGVEDTDLERFKEICERERCPYAIVGHATKNETLVLSDSHFKNNPVELPMSILFGKASQTKRAISRATKRDIEVDINNIELEDAVKRVLHLPAVGSKKFLITIGDRTVGGLTVRDQMVGPWQVPVSDVAVTASGFGSRYGEAMAMGERTPLAVGNAAASARMAVAESITNIAATPIKSLSEIALSANWMAAAGYKNEDQNLFDAVTAIGEEFCPSLGITIPVGKDSLSMRTVWQENENNYSVTSPLSLIITAFAPVIETSKVLTPCMKRNENTTLLYIDLGAGKNRLGGSALAQVYNQTGTETPDADPQSLIRFFNIIQKLNMDNKILAYHDRSDGGLFVALSEMAFASRMGLNVNLQSLSGNVIEKLFNEELGAVVQIDNSNLDLVFNKLKKALGDNVFNIGNPTIKQNIVFRNGSNKVLNYNRSQLELWWSETSYAVQSLRDNPIAAKQEYDAINDDADPGLSPKFNFSLKPNSYKNRPRVAIFREQGVNGQVEMAAAFDAAGFDAFDIHMSDLISKKRDLKEFSVLVACGGFSYGDVLGAGAGWAKTIINNSDLRKMFADFFERKDTLSLGVCNGCQMLAGLKEIIPGTNNWPELKRNVSEQFEARLSSIKVLDSKSVFLKDMKGAILPVPVAHGEGKMEFKNNAAPNLSLVYVDNLGKVTDKYPFNPNGSDKGAAGVTSDDGRVTILMPHPERGFLTQQFSWHPDTWGEYGPWLKMFCNARDWIG